jgi:hypothetical protein
MPKKHRDDDPTKAQLLPNTDASAIPPSSGNREEHHDPFSVSADPAPDETIPDDLEEHTETVVEVESDPAHGEDEAELREFYEDHPPAEVASAVDDHRQDTPRLLAEKGTPSQCMR